MRILWFTNILLPQAAAAFGLPISSYGGWMTGLLEALRRRYYEDSFCVISASSVNRRADFGNVSYRTIVGPRFSSFERGVPRSITSQIKAIVDEFHPDIIHIHGSENYFARIEPEVFSGIPVLVSLQGVINGLHTFYNGTLSESELRRFSKTIRNLIRRDGVQKTQDDWRNHKAVQEKKAFEHHRFFAGRTDWDRVWLSYINPQCKYFHLEEILREDFYQVERSSRTIHRNTIYCSASGAYPLKGLHVLLKALAFLAPRFPDLKIIVADFDQFFRKPSRIIAKLKDQEYHKYIRWLIRNLRLNDKVVALPQLDAASVAEQLASAHIFCLPSLCENSPNSLAEAMMVGTPCVVPYAGGVPSMVRAGACARLFQPGDPAALAKAIEDIIIDDSLADKYAREAKRIALEIYDPNRICLEYHEAYFHVIEEAAQLLGSEQ
jgi:L-malate glycosyltransferase